MVAGTAFVAEMALTRGRRPATGSTIAGALVAGVSAVVGAASLAEFRRAKTSADPVDIDDATALVGTGPFRYSRNPMYTALGGMLLSHAVGRRSWRAVLPVAGYFAVMDRVQIPAEEAALCETFGAEFDDYARRVPRWLGYVRS